MSDSTENTGASSEATATLETTETTETADSPAATSLPAAPVSLRRWIAPAIGLAAVLYGALWLPAVVFHVTFQKLVTTGDLGARSGSMLGARLVPFRRSEASGAANAGAGAWHQVPFGDVLVSLPPGVITAADAEEKTLAVTYDGGKVLVDRFAPELIRAIFLEEIDHVGGDLSRLPRGYLEVPDGLLLQRITATTPADYSFGMSKQERSLYAATICAKLRLWDFEEVDSVHAIGSDRAGGVFMRARDGRSKAIVAVPQGVFIFTVEGRGLADAAKGQLDLWLEVLPLGDELRKVWAKRARERYPEGHPLRALAGGE